MLKTKFLLYFVFVLYNFRYWRSGKKMNEKNTIVVLKLYNLLLDCTESSLDIFHSLKIVNRRYFDFLIDQRQSTVHFLVYEKFFFLIYHKYLFFHRDDSIIVLFIKRQYMSITLGDMNSKLN